MQNDKRELATNKLLEILRTGKEADSGKEKTEEIPEMKEEIPEPLIDKSDEEQQAVAEKKKVSFSGLIDIAVDRVKKIINPQKGILALDIGSNSVKYVIVKNVGDETIVTELNFKRLESAEKSPQEIKELKIAAVKELISPDMIEENDIISTVYGPKVSIRRITMPKVGRKEQHDAILWNAKKDLPFAPETALIDYEISGEVEEKGIPKLEIFVAAADNAVITEHLDLLKKAGIIPFKIIPVALALFNSYLNIFRGAKIEDGAIIDIGAENSYIIFVNEGKLQFAREISTGGNDITKGMIGSISTQSGVVKIGNNKAEELKIKYGIPEADSFRETPEGIPLSHISSLMTPVIERIASQIQRSLDYFRNKFPYDEPERIYLSGGTSMLKNFDVFLSETLGKEIKTFSPFDYIDIADTIPEKDASKLNALLFSVTTGMTFEAKGGLNLLPAELKIIPMLKLQKRIIKIAAIFLTVFLVSASGLTYLDYKQSSDELNQIKTQQGSVGKFFQHYSELQNQINMMKQKNNEFLKDLNQVGKVPDVVHILKVLSNETPDYITLNSLEISEEGITSVTIEGSIKNKGYNSEMLLADYSIKLQESGIFNRIEPFEGQPEDELSMNYKFKIVCLL